MSNTTIPSVQRISKTTKKWMLFFAAFFDLLAVFAVILLVFFIMFQISTTFGNQLGMIQSSIDQNTAEGSYVPGLPGSGGEAVLGATVMAGKVFLGAGAVLFIGPIIYTIVSFVATFSAYIIFTIWFFTKGVNIWSFNSAERVGINMVSGLIEFIPILNLLPGITVMVWRHIKISQKEDQAKEAERSKKIQTQLQNSGQNSSRQRVSPALRAV